MKKILFSLALILAVGGIVAVGGTSAFLSDTEASVGNTFAAGAIDLKVDNESYYNGNKCAVDINDIDQDENVSEYVWQGNSLFPVPGTSCSTSWTLDDLDKGLLFFNFRDIKPDDEGEDTISIHVNNNDAYLCMDMTLTSGDDNSSTEPELEDGDVQDDENLTWDGELGDQVKMAWWVDDGDNVLETGETLLNGGVKSVKDFFGEDKTFSADLADATTNVWTGEPGPAEGGETYYIAKAWCFGNLTLNPVTAGQGVNPSVASGVVCNGTALDNITQTDGATMDIAFRAVQARHNGGYTCGEETPRTATLTVTKVVVNNNGGNNVVADYQLQVVNSVVTNVTSGVANVLSADDYTVTETGIAGYQASFSGDCNAAGQITLLPGNVKSCTVTNDDIAPNITLVKSVVNDNGGTALPANFTMKIDSNVVPQNTSVAVTANSAHSIDEVTISGYHFVSITGSAKCPAVLLGTATLDEGEAITCTITNSDDGGSL